MRVKMLNKKEVEVDTVFAVQNWKSSLKSILRWMSFIGLYSDDHNKGKCYSCKRIYCYFFYAIILVIEFWSVYSSLLNIENITESLTAKNSSAALIWSIVIDTFNFAIYLVLGAACALILTGPKEWTSLLDSLQKFQSHANSSQFGKNEAKMIHKLSILAVFYVTFSVMLHREPKDHII